MKIGLVGRKRGMTRVFTEEGQSIPVTVIEVDPNRVTQVKNDDTDGYRSVQVTIGQRRQSLVNKPVAGHYAKAGVEAGEGLAGKLLSEVSNQTYDDFAHIVSNVRGRPRPGTTPGEVIRALFPGGTITGCPKVRCMEIIAGLEQQARGAYTGSMGYLNRDGSMDLNILIRTMTVTADQIRLRAGAGIVADSRPQAELDETRAKARGLLRALGVRDT